MIGISSRPPREFSLTSAGTKSPGQVSILKYPWRRGENPKKNDKWGAYHSEDKDFEFATQLRGRPLELTIEAKLMDWSDDITYSVHDLDDFYRAHRIPLHLLADRLYDQERGVFFEAAFRRHADRSGLWTDPQSLRESFNQVMIGLFPLNNPYGGTWKERAALRQFSSQLIGRYLGNTSLEIKGNACELKIDDHLLREVAMLKELTWIYVIEAPSLVSQQFGQRHAIRKLFEIYMNASAKPASQNLFPAFYREAIEDAKSDEKQVKRTVIDLIAGMTENQALAMYNRLIGVSVGSGLEEIVR